MLTDETRIGQITNNLTNNALKFTPAGGTVTLRANLVNKATAVDMWKKICTRFAAHHIQSKSAAVPVEPEKVEKEHLKPLIEQEEEGIDEVQVAPPIPRVATPPLVSKSYASSRGISATRTTAVTTVVSSSEEGDCDNSPLGKVAQSFGVVAETSLWYVYQVEDTGCGVTGQDMTVMFDAYKQVSSGVTKTYQGTGLGLHICNCHVALLKGVLSVASTPGQGTLFFCAIPVTLHQTKQLPLLNLVLTIDSLDEKHAQVSSSCSSTPSMAQIFTTGKECGFPEHVSSPFASTATTPTSQHSAVSPFFLIVDDSAVNLRLTKKKIELALGKICRVCVQAAFRLHISFADGYNHGQPYA